MEFLLKTDQELYEFHVPVSHIRKDPMINHVYTDWKEMAVGTGRNGHAMNLKYQYFLI